MFRRLIKAAASAIARGLRRIRRATRPASKATIDLASFPHLLSDIIQLSDSNTYLVLRQTCKGMQDLCDGRWLAHCSLDSGGLRLQAYLHSTLHGITLPLGHDLTAHSPSGLKRIRLPPKWIRHAARVRIMDMRERGCLDELQAKDFANVRTVRLFPSPAMRIGRWSVRAMKPWRMVVFPNPANRWQWKHGFFVPDSVRRLVIHHTKANVTLRIGPDVEVFCLLHDTVPKADYATMARNLAVLCFVEHQCRMTIVTPPDSPFRVRFESMMHEEPWILAGRDYSHFEEVPTPAGLLSKTKFIDMDTFREESPHFGLETNPYYRLSIAELSVLARGDVEEMESMGL